MSLFVAITSLLLASNGSRPVPEGCEKVCEKQYVPCSGERVDEQMMCVDVVRRCEIRCEPQAGQKQASRKSTAKK